MAIVTVNPATGQQVRSFDALTGEELERKLSRAVEAFGEYRWTPFAQRATLLHRAAQILENEADELARLATLEVGSQIRFRQSP